MSGPEGSRGGQKWTTSGICGPFQWHESKVWYRTEKFLNLEQ